MTLRGRSPLYAYVSAIGALLLVQGTVSLLLHGTRFGSTESTHGLVTVSIPHALIHVVWGIATVGLVAARADDRMVVAFATAFAAFYGVLTMLGLAGDDPFGLPLGIGENAFHATITTVALALLAHRARAVAR